MYVLRTAPSRSTLISILGAAILFRAACCVLFPIGTEAGMQQRVGDEKFYFQIAHAIVERGEFVEGHLRAYRPPLYPAMLALNLWLFGDRTWILSFVQNLMILGAAALLSVHVAKRYSAQGGLICGMLIILSPCWVLLPQQANSESLFVLLLIGGIIGAARLLERGGVALERGGIARALGCGVLLGGAALTREIGLFFGVAIVACLWLTARTQLGAKAATRTAALMLLGMALVVGAWTARNYGVFGRIVPIATNGPLNFFIGNSPQATGHFHFFIPAQSRALWNTPSEHGANEIESMAIMGREAVRFISENPGRVAALSLKRLAWLWFPTPTAPLALTPRMLALCARAAFLSVYSLLAIYGLFRMRRMFLGKALIALACVTSLVHAMTHVDVRFRAPLDVALAVPVSLILLEVAARRRLRWSGAHDGQMESPGLSPVRSMSSAIRGEPLEAHEHMVHKKPRASGAER
ncbi:ArnT family glycosyltransferase [Sorangium sp. So ce131]|uniref:ArnT family glycosyltransferase n=1 Tax=Sorangium sp. So ce131 TaxID=3133282 RepID=UPI003F61D0DA